MKVLVTGAAGFIGSHIAEAFLSRGHEVVGLDILEDKALPNLQPLFRHRNRAFDYVRGHAGDPALLNQVLPGTDWVFHSAATPSVPRSIAEPIESNRTNLDATLQLLLASREHQVKRFVFASSSAVYGDNPASPKSERLPPKPISPYGLQKYAAESYAQLFYQLYGLETVSLRYFNVFGPRQAFDSPYSGVIARFCCTMLEGKAPTIYGDGCQTRDFTYVDNVVEANLRAVEADSSRVAGRIFNIATGRSIRLLDLVEALNRLTGQSLVPDFKPERRGDIRHSKADISSAMHSIDYHVKVSWEEGLQNTLEWYRKLPS